MRRVGARRDSGHGHWWRRRVIGPEISVCGRFLSTAAIGAAVLLVVAGDGLLRGGRCRVDSVAGVATKAVGAIAAMVVGVVMVALEVLLHLLLLEVLLVVEGSLLVDLDPVGLGSPVLEPDLMARDETRREGEDKVLVQ